MRRAVQSYARARTDHDFRHNIAVHVVWEITLACDLKCLHCGSRAGRPRLKELTTDECLGVVDHLARLGTREISLIGGEAYLREDWTEIVRAIRSHNIYCAIQTGGRNLTDERLNKAIHAGLQGVGISLDGLKPLHDKIRGVSGSFEKAVDALKRSAKAGLNTSVNTHIGAETVKDLPALMDVIRQCGAKQWQIQLTVPMGNAVDNDFLLLQPFELLDLMPILAELYQKGAENGLLLVMGNNIGYFGPYEHIWRGFGDASVHWEGCAAGQTVIALEADGTVKGCPSLPTVGYAAGNVRRLSIEEIWKRSSELQHARARSTSDLWGFCKSCYYADVCRAGCTWTAHSLLGRPGNNPYCHYRALELKKKGIRERVEKIEGASKDPFSVGKFVLIEETQSASSIVSCPLTFGMTSISSASVPDHTESGRVQPTFAVCHACNCYIKSSESECPHCRATVSTSIKKHKLEKQLIEDAKTRILNILETYANSRKNA